jgi:hypothetical protein
METQSESPEWYVPWQRKEKIGLFKAFWGTIKQALFRPRELFSNLEADNSYWEPASFIAIVLAIFFFVAPFSLSLSNVLNIKRIPFPLLADETLIFAFPVLIVVFVSVGTAGLLGIGFIAHSVALFFKGSGGTRGTVNVVAYSSVAVIFCAIPVVGLPIGVIWAFCVGVVGIEIVHQLDKAKSTAVYLTVIISAALLSAAGLKMLAVSGPSYVQINANEQAAEATVRSVSSAIETYKVVRQRYPQSEDDLKGMGSAYISRHYNNMAMQGYNYTLSLRQDGYTVEAKPSECGDTGMKMFKMTEDSVFSVSNCTARSF